MKPVKFVMAVLALSLFMAGCSKDKDQVSELEQEVLEQQSEDILTEETQAEDSVQIPEGAEEYTMTPEAAPVEETEEYDYDEPAAGGYTIQVAAGTNQTYARYMADKFVTRGYDAFVTKTIYEGETFYRIRIGAYETLTEARNIAKELQDKYSVNFWIDNN